MTPLLAVDNLRFWYDAGTGRVERATDGVSIFLASWRFCGWCLPVFSVRAGPRPRLAEPHCQAWLRPLQWRHTTIVEVVVSLPHACRRIP